MGLSFDVSLCLILSLAITTICSAVLSLLLCDSSWRPVAPWKKVERERGSAKKREEGRGEGKNERYRDTGAEKERERHTHTHLSSRLFD